MRDELDSRAIVCRGCCATINEPKPARNCYKQYPGVDRREKTNEPLKEHIMKFNLQALTASIIFLTAIFGSVLAQTSQTAGIDNQGFYSFTMKDIDGKDKPLADFKGKVVLVVNTASKCGYTPQYESLESLYQKYKDKGLAILAFPANNFGGQEPGTNDEIRRFCAMKFDVTFNLFSKISVKGKDMHPLYAWLTAQDNVSGDIKWNFNKFLLDANGIPVARFDSKTDPLSEPFVQKVEDLLNKK
jgi:glutathione peroxidase